MMGHRERGRERERDLESFYEITDHKSSSHFSHHLFASTPFVITHPCTQRHHQSAHYLTSSIPLDSIRHHTSLHSEASPIRALLDIIYSFPSILHFDETIIPIATSDIFNYKYTASPSPPQINKKNKNKNPTANPIRRNTLYDLHSVSCHGI